MSMVMPPSALEPPPVPPPSVDGPTLAGTLPRPQPAAATHAARTTDSTQRRMAFPSGALLSRGRASGRARGRAAEVGKGVLSGGNNDVRSWPAEGRWGVLSQSAMDTD